MIKNFCTVVLVVLLATNVYAQVADSFYNAGSKYYNENKKELAKQCLLNLINKQITHNDSSKMSSVLGYAYYLNLSYDLLKMIYFEEGDYVNALVYIEKQFKYNKTRNARDFFAIAADLWQNDSFSVECYYAMKDYKNAMEISARHIFAERMSIIFVNSTVNRFSKEALKDEFIEEFEKIPEWKVEYDSSDKKNIKIKVIGPRHVILNIFGYELHIYLLKEAEKIENDLIDNKLTLETANVRFKDEIKKMPIYKLIMEN